VSKRLISRTGHQYACERLLVEDLCLSLKSDSTPWGRVDFACEFDYCRGRADVVVVNEDDDVIAFEAKLQRWRDAVHQAYRNRCFAHHSYVLVPSHVAERARTDDREFRRRRVGLCHLEAGSVVVTVPSVRQTPIQLWLSELAIETVRESGNGQRREQP